MENYHFLFKYIMVGDTSVGKSCILLKYTEKRFNEDHETTIGVEFGSQLFKMNDKSIKIQIWDTAGQESFKSITRQYYKGSIGVVLVFDLTKKETFYNVMKWYNEILDCTHEFVEISLVGNKLDLESERQISTKEALEYAQSNKMNYLETSAKTGQNIDQIFEDLAQRILVKIDNNAIDYTQEGLFFKILNKQQAYLQLQNQNQIKRIKNVVDSIYNKLILIINTNLKMLDYSIGKICKYSICKQKDFLPFTCTLCKNDFCQEHRTPDAHECTQQSIKKQAILCPICNKGISYTSDQNENIIWEQHFLKDCPQHTKEKKCCPICKTKLTDLNSIKCMDCGMEVCLKHRQKEDHKCPTLIFVENKQKKNIPEQQNLQQQQPIQSEQCPICGKNFPYIMQVIRHVEIDHP